MEHNKALRKGRLDNYLSWMGLGIVTAGLAIIMVQSYCTISSYFELGLVVLGAGVAAVVMGGIYHSSPVRTEYAGVKTLSPDHVTHCPICGQKLPRPDDRLYGNVGQEEY